MKKLYCTLYQLGTVRCVQQSLFQMKVQNIPRGNCIVSTITKEFLTLSISFIPPVVTTQLSAKLSNWKAKQTNKTY